jgi:hypothetical protein
MTKIILQIKQLNYHLLPSIWPREAIGCLLRMRRAVALPVYIVGLMLSLFGDALGILAVKIAGDDWPE